MAWTIFSHQNEFVVEERVQIAGIPCLKFRPKGVEGRLPTVIYYHGWHSSKDFQRFKGAVLATYGYQVIVPDALHHGERNPVNHDEPDALELYFWPTVIQSVEESTDFIAELVRQHSVQAGRVAVMGSSMGGFTASGVFVKNPDLCCMINLNGACAWIEVEEMYRQMDGKPSLSDAERTHLARYDALVQKEKLQCRPVLLLHGDEDTAVPIEGQRVFYREVAPMYQEVPERLVFTEVGRMNHYVSVGMLEEALDWLKKYL